MNPTIKTIAKAAGVSTATVSKALNDMPDISEATKAHIRRICEEMGYTPNASARSLASGSTRTIGLVVPDTTHALVSGIVQSIVTRMMKHGYTVFLCDSENSLEQERLSIHRMLENQVAALIILPVATAEPQRGWEAELSRARIPYAGLFQRLPAADVSVLIDDHEGGRLVARYLSGKGHRRCAVFLPAALDKNGEDRVRGFDASLREQGGEALVYRAPQGLAGEDAGLALARAWKGQGETAVFAADDALAAGAMAGFAERGIEIPANLSLAGYGDLPFAGLRLMGLTTLRVPTLEMGICAGDAVAAILERKEGAPRQYRLSTTLVERETVGIPRPIPRKSGPSRT